MKKTTKKEVKELLNSEVIGIIISLRNGTKIEMSKETFQELINKNE